MNYHGSTERVSCTRAMDNGEVEVWWAIERRIVDITEVCLFNTGVSSPFLCLSNLASYVKK